MLDLERLKKHKTMLFLNTSVDSTLLWSRIGRSTIFDLTLNANEVESDFIEDEMPTTDIDKYSPKLPQELQANKGDPAFDYLYDMLYTLPTGEDLKKDILVVFAGNFGTAQAPEFKAWKCQCTLIITDFNTVDEKINFELRFNKIERGTATVTDGVPTYVSPS